MVRYDLPKTGTDAITAVFASNALYLSLSKLFSIIYFIAGQAVTGNKTGTPKISFSTLSLEMLIDTFMFQIGSAL